MTIQDVDALITFLEERKQSMANPAAGRPQDGAANTAGTYTIPV